MVLESTMICVDNSEFMRNGDYVPTRLQAQQDAVNTVCRFKLRANPENNVGLLTLANTEVLATLTTDAGKILTTLHKVQPIGFINLLTGIRIAHLALKHRQSKNHKMRIVVFVGSPISVDEKEALKLGKRLKKENVNIDVVSFGETDINQTILAVLVNTINGREGTGSHLVTIPPSPHLAEALMSSPIIQGEDGVAPGSFATGGGFDFGVDPNEDPELALALRVSMEEQRQRQQEEERRAQQESAGDAVATGLTPSTAQPTASAEGQTEDEMLRQALALSLEDGSRIATAGSQASSSAKDSSGIPVINFDTMTEEEQIAYAMQISLQGCQPKEEAMDVELAAEEKPKREEKKAEAAAPPDTNISSLLDTEQDFSQVMSDFEFLQGVLQSLPGVDPESQVVKQAVGSLTRQDKDKKNRKNEDKEEEEEGDKK